MTLHRARAFLLLFLTGVVTLACGRTGDARVGDETHFIRCSTDENCPASAPSCRAGYCRKEASRTSPSGGAGGDRGALTLGGTGGSTSTAKANGGAATGSGATTSSSGGQTNAAGGSVADANGGSAGDPGARPPQPEDGGGKPPNADGAVPVTDGATGTTDSGPLRCCDTSAIDGKSWCVSGNGVEIPIATFPRPGPAPLPSSCLMGINGGALSPTDFVLLRFAIVLPVGHSVEVYINSADRTALQVDFEDGKIGNLVSGPGTVTRDMTYVPDRWNTVEALFRPQSLDFFLKVNGVSGGPFPVGDPTRPQPTSLVALGFVGDIRDTVSAFRIDSVYLATVSDGGTQTVLVDESFDGGPIENCGSTIATDAAMCR